MNEFAHFIHFLTFKFLFYILKLVVNKREVKILKYLWNRPKLAKKRSHEIKLLSFILIIERIIGELSMMLKTNTLKGYSKTTEHPRIFMNEIIYIRIKPIIIIHLCFFLSEII